MTTDKLTVDDLEHLLQRSGTISEADAKVLQQLYDTMRENERLRQSIENADVWLRAAFDFAKPEYGGTAESNLEHAKWHFPKIHESLWSWRDQQHKESDNG
jgi:hypothetical protein